MRIHQLLRLTYVHSLELNIRQLILSDLASNIGEVKADKAAADSVLSAIDLITSKVETRAIDESHGRNEIVEERKEEESAEEREEKEPTEERVFMVRISILPSHPFISCAMRHSPTHACNAILVSPNSL